MAELIVFLILISLGYFCGRVLESRHFRSIQAREHQLLYLPVVTLKSTDDQRPVADVALISGSVVISIDYFKRFLATLRALFGGRISAYETLIDRGRREAILRMKEQAGNADIIFNLRIETSAIGKGEKDKVTGIEVLAYGTAVTYKQGDVETPPPLPTAAAPQDSTFKDTDTETASQFYDVMFSGKIAEGQDLQTVKETFMALYKLPPETCERIFSGAEITLKKNMDAPTAHKYKKAFEQTGAICLLKPSEP